MSEILLKSILDQYVLVNIFLKDCKHALHQGVSIQFNKRMLNELRNAVLLIMTFEEALLNKASSNSILDEQHVSDHIDFVVNISVLMDKINATHEHKYVDQFLTYFEDWMIDHRPSLAIQK